MTVTVSVYLFVFDEGFTLTLKKKKKRKIYIRLVYIFVSGMFPTYSGGKKKSRHEILKKKKKVWRVLQFYYTLNMSNDRFVKELLPNLNLSQILV